ncbi:MAG: Eco57I restriction-modification methylase domain-containing protein [Promethearchaeota archaeon]
MVEVQWNEIEEEFDISIIINEILESSENSPTPEFLSQSWTKLWKRIYTEYLNQDNLKNSDLNRINHIERLSALYQYYLTHHLEFETDTIQIVSDNDLIRMKGIIYTPAPVSHFIIDWIIGEELGNLNNKKTILQVADIACGTGQFLTDLARKSLQYEILSNLELWGYDRDEDAIKIAQLLNSEVHHFVHSDSLFDPQLEQENQFDLILGNPPYIKSSTIADEYWKALRASYSCAFSKFDLAVVFLEKIVRLLKPEGIAGLIISNKWMVSHYGKSIRKYLLDHVWIKILVDVSQLEVFNGISTYPIIIIFRKKNPQTDENHPQLISIFKPHNLQELSAILADGERKTTHIIDQSFFNLTPDNIFITDIYPQDIRLLTHFWNMDEKQIFLLNSTKSPYLLKKGIHTGNVKSKLVFNSIPPTEMDNPNYKNLITSRQKVEQFKISWQGLWINYDPAVFSREEGDYGSLREAWIFEATPKIMIKLFGIKLQAAIDFFQTYANNSLILLIKKNQNPNYSASPGKIDAQITKGFAAFADLELEFYYLLGILNSSLISHYYRVIFSHTHVRGGYLQFYVKDLSKIPIIIPTKHNFELAREIAKSAKQLTSYHAKPIKNYDEILVTKQELDEKVALLYNWKEN